ncbi:negative transcriptional regulator [Scheffersomyces xylosifermentans]|uniref:negative transcriptional regulator n=1 Tax=Scheffersomyces xylosifermentans TaxID=1304137 RepID=UPI00315D1BE0
MSARKLQQEFDKTNKKIAEGLSVFDDIYDKLMTTEISSQKEKLESDLKKEIKKLQRSRDQLKQWLGDSSIKLDKELLQENRTKIEHAMDQFKDLEKSSKIKQFSNEGLELQSQRTKHNRFGPEGAKIQEACVYISDIIDLITQQNDDLEQDVQQLTGQLKKAKSSNQAPIQSSIEDGKYKIERNNNHLTKLESILRNLENERLDPSRIDDIKDDLEYYVENNQEEDYVEYDDFYESLEIDEDATLEVHGSLAQMAADNQEYESNVDFPELKGDEPTTPAKPEVKPASAPAVSTPINTKVSISPGSSSAIIGGSTPTKRHNVVQAPAPPPITAYSNVIKAAAQSMASNSIPSAAVKAPPPGLNPIEPKSASSSPQAANSTINEEGDDTPLQSHAQPVQTQSLSQSQSPILSEENRAFFDTTARLSTIPQSRLQNPLPFQFISSMLETSLLNCPDSFDAERPRQYNPVNIHPSSIDYPQEPMYELNSSNIMKKFDNDTLFFCFYYSEGVDNLAKWNSAQELSRRGWVFNTELKQWFLKDTKNGGKNRSVSVIQKEEEQIDDGNKEENYKYFDYEKTWLTRRRENYKFSNDLRETF